MKIKTRRERLAEYNLKYHTRDYDPEKSLHDYFEQRGWDYAKAQKKAGKKLDEIVKQREYETITITMYEYPMSTSRPRSTSTGHTYSPNAAENHQYFEKAVHSVCNAIKLINTPAEILIEAYIEMPKAVKPDEVILFEAKVLDPSDMPDYDNIGKCYTDILKNVLVIDDDLIHFGAIKKYYSVIPRVVIHITYLKKHESEYIYKKIKNRKSVKAAIEAGQLELQRIQY